MRARAPVSSLSLLLCFLWPLPTTSGAADEGGHSIGKVSTTGHLIVVEMNEGALGQQNLFGLTAGPLLTGALSDLYGLPFALSVVPAFCVAAAAVFALAARTYVADLEAARD